MKEIVFRNTAEAPTPTPTSVTLKLHIEIPKQDSRFVIGHSKSQKGTHCKSQSFLGVIVVVSMEFLMIIMLNCQKNQAVHAMYSV